MASKRDREHLGLLASTGEIATLVAGSANIQSFLDRAVEMVSAHLDADVCSIYLYDDAHGDLVMRANRGLNPDVVGRLRLKLGEGLVGRALKELRPIYEPKASQNPNYKFFPEAGEDRFETFLAVPIQRGVEKIGVLVVQRERAASFSEADIIAMRVLTAQLATAVESARVLLSVSAESSAAAPDEDPGPTSAVFRGQSVSRGCAIGDARVMRRGSAASVLDRQRNRDVPTEAKRTLEEAVERTERQLIHYQETLGERLPEAASMIFEAHLMMLKDVSFVGKIRARVEEGMMLPRAVAETATEYIALFESSRHDYLREKARDVEDLAVRLLEHLCERSDDADPESAAHIVIARELLPSDILRIAQGNVQGIILASGGATSHVSILVRSLGIPTVIANAPDLVSLKDGVRVIVDAESGSVHVHPGDDVVASYERRRLAEKEVLSHAGQMLDTTETRDGVRVKLLANINLLSELNLAMELRAEGIGLYRTEFPFLVRQSLPTETDQESVYRHLMSRVADRPVTFRTLDAGGDKVLSYFDSAREENPALGLRSTRFSLKYPEIFDQQLRAILRASAGRSDVRIMFPMIGSLEELRAAQNRLDSCVADIACEGGSSFRPQVGMMVELPAVIEMADEFAGEVDFFSIGTNDFIQYMLGVDRTNDQVAEYYCAHHPSVLRALRRIVQAAGRGGIDVSVCGEMAHDARYVPFFIGLGVRTLSVEPIYLPRVQKAVNHFSLADARRYAELLLAQSSISRIEALLIDPLSIP